MLLSVLGLTVFRGGEIAARAARESYPARYWHNSRLIRSSTERSKRKSYIGNYPYLENQRSGTTKFMSSTLSSRTHHRAAIQRNCISMPGPDCFCEGMWSLKPSWACFRCKPITKTIERLTGSNNPFSSVGPCQEGVGDERF